MSSTKKQKKNTIFSVIIIICLLGILACAGKIVYTKYNHKLLNYTNYKQSLDKESDVTLEFTETVAATSLIGGKRCYIVRVDVEDYKTVAVIGDSTFTHSGMTGLLDAINDNSPITVIISDNLTTGMTGGQDSAGTNKFEAICLGLGMDPEHLHVVTPLPKNIPAIADLIRKELAYEGVSVIIPRRECIQTASRHAREKAKAKA